MKKIFFLVAMIGLLSCDEKPKDEIDKEAIAQNSQETSNPSEQPRVTNGAGLHLASHKIKIPNGPLSLSFGSRIRWFRCLVYDTEQKQVMSFYQNNVAEYKFYGTAHDRSLESGKYLFRFSYQANNKGAKTQYQDEYIEVINLEEDFKALYKKWTSQQQASGSYFRLTYLSEELLDAWYELETSAGTKSKINKLRNKTDELIFYLSVAPTYKDKVYMRPFKANVKLAVTNVGGRQYTIDKFTGNLNAWLTGESSYSEDYKWYSGCFTIKNLPDEYSFKVLSINFLDERRKRHGIQHTFRLNGVPESEQATDLTYSKLSILDILSILQTVLDLLTFF